jgi:hypothetical protein
MSIRKSTLIATAGLVASIFMALCTPIAEASPPAFHFSATGPKAAGVADPATEFSTSSNPNGKWSYLANGSLLTHKVKQDWCGIEKVSAWYNKEQEPDSVSISDNPTKKLITCNDGVIMPADSLDLDPEGLPNVALQWTVKKAGTYTVAGQFGPAGGSSENSHPVAILHNATSVYSNTMSTSTESFDVNISASAGDTISFVVSTGSTYTYLGTSVQATIAKS